MFILFAPQKNAMIIGVVGAPNKGKSTFFSALTASDVMIADYPFTTIDPNRGVVYVRVPCAHVALGLPKCDARGGHCHGGVREIPVQLIDVAGLVPDAHSGKGMGNQFLDDLRQADALIQIIDASGRTDLEGKVVENSDLGAEIDFLPGEISYWVAGILKRNWDKIRNRGIADVGLVLSGFGANADSLAASAKNLSLPIEKINWAEDEILEFAGAVAATKPIVIAANKADVPGALAAAKKLAEKTGKKIYPCSAACERALRKASERGAIKYSPGEASFEVIVDVTQKQREGLAQLAAFMKGNRGSGVPQILHHAVFDVLKMKVAYPVEDEHKYSDHMGRVLPDAALLPQKARAIDLAEKIHTDLAAHFIGAIDAKSRMRIGRDHLLVDGDVIKIIAAK